MPVTCSCRPICLVPRFASLPSLSLPFQATWPYIQTRLSLLHLATPSSVTNLNETVYSHFFWLRGPPPRRRRPCCSCTVWRRTCPQSVRCINRSLVFDPSQTKWSRVLDHSPSLSSLSAMLTHVYVWIKTVRGFKMYTDKKDNWNIGRCNWQFCLNLRFCIMCLFGSSKMFLWTVAIRVFISDFCS